MCFTVLRSKAVSLKICDKQHQLQLVNYMPTTRQWEIQNSMFRTPVDYLFFRLLRESSFNMTRGGMKILKLEA